MMKKKLILGVSTLSALMLLGACQSNAKPATPQTEETMKATLTVKFEDKTDTKVVTFEKDDSVMDVLEEAHDIEEEEGMVTAIDGVRQNAAENTYWMYDVNDELAPKGAEEMTLSDGDTVTFYLETFD